MWVQLLALLMGLMSELLRGLLRVVMTEFPTEMVLVWRGLGMVQKLRKLARV